MNFNNNRIVITEKENVLCTCIFEEDELVSFQASPKNSSLIGNIYLGRVQKIVPNINAAFVEIQKGILCYLPLEKHHHFKGGAQILVQILKDKLNTKEAVVTTNI